MWIATDKDGKIVSTHLWGGVITDDDHCPLIAPQGGALHLLDEQTGAEVTEYIKEGHPIRYDPTERKIHVLELRQQLRISRKVSSPVEARRKKMIEIGEQSVASRNRVFKNLPHVPASRKNQAYDGLLALIVRGRISHDHKVIVRNLKSGEYDELTVGQLLDEVGEMYLLQLGLRKQDQTYREKVNGIFKDQQLSDEDKARMIEAIELPEFLDVDEESTSANLVSRRANGKPNGKTG